MRLCSLSNKLHLKKCWFKEWMGRRERSHMLKNKNITAFTKSLKQNKIIIFSDGSECFVWERSRMFCVSWASQRATQSPSLPTHFLHSMPGRYFLEEQRRTKMPGMQNSHRHPDSKFAVKHHSQQVTFIDRTVLRSRGWVHKVFATFREGGYNFSNFIGFLLTSFAKKLQGGSTFIPPHSHVCIYGDVVKLFYSNC